MSNNRFALPLAAVIVFGTTFVAPASAKTYCCTDSKGSRVCGDTMPPQCEDRAYKEIGPQGVRTVEAPLTAEQKAQRQAAEARKKEEERAAAEQRRKDQALLSTYGTEKDIDRERDRAISDREALGKSAQDKYNVATKRKQDLEKELGFYAKKPVPDALKSQIKDNDAELAAQKKALDDKNADIDVIRKRFEDDRQRYQTLTQGDGKAAGQAPAKDTRPR